MADATSDAVVYGLLGAACALTLVGVMALRDSSATVQSPRGGTA